MASRHTGASLKGTLPANSVFIQCETNLLDTAQTPGEASLLAGTSTLIDDEVTRRTLCEQSLAGTSTLLAGASAQHTIRVETIDEEPQPESTQREALGFLQAAALSAAVADSKHARNTLGASFSLDASSTFLQPGGYSTLTNVSKRNSLRGSGAAEQCDPEMTQKLASQNSIYCTIQEPRTLKVDAMDAPTIRDMFRSAAFTEEGPADATQILHDNVAGAGSATNYKGQPAYHSTNLSKPLPQELLSPLAEAFYDDSDEDGVEEVKSARSHSPMSEHGQNLEASMSGSSLALSSSSWALGSSRFDKSCLSTAARDNGCCLNSKALDATLSEAFSLTARSLGDTITPVASSAAAAGTSQEPEMQAKKANVDPRQIDTAKLETFASAVQKASGLDPGLQSDLLQLLQALPAQTSHKCTGAH